MTDHLTDLLADALRSNYDRYRNSRAGVVVAALRANPDVVLSALEEWGVLREVEQEYHNGVAVGWDCINHGRVFVARQQEGANGE